MIATSNLLARGFDTVLRRYLPKLLCFEVKPSYTYTRSDYMRLLVNSSVLNAYAEGMSNVSNEIGSRAPNSDTALMRFKSIDRYELQSVVSIVLEEQVDELKRDGLLKKARPDSLRLARPDVLRRDEDGHGQRHQAESRLLVRLSVSHCVNPCRRQEADDCTQSNQR